MPGINLHRGERAADALRVAMSGAAATFLLIGEHALGVKALLLVCAGMAARRLTPLPLFDLAFTLALGGELVVTALEAYGVVDWSDTVSHIALPFLCAPIVYGALTRLRAPEGRPGLAGLQHPVGATLYTAGAVLVVGVAWELVEWASDSALGTDFSSGPADTRSDLANDGIGGLAAAAMLGAWLRWSGRTA